MKSVDLIALVARYVWVQDPDCVSLGGRRCAQVQVRTLAMHIPRTFSPDHRADSCYFGCTKKSRAVWQPSAPNAVVARQRMQPNPPMHLKANGDTSRADGGTPLRASSASRRNGCTVCGDGVQSVHIAAAAMCESV